MNTRNTIEQLETALKIERAKAEDKQLEWEVYPQGAWGYPASFLGPIWYVGRGILIRLKPWTLGDEINGHKLGPGQQWHRTDWMRDMLPEGYRPLILNEIRGNCHISCDRITWTASEVPGEPVCENTSLWYRTTRPLPPTKWAAERQAHKEGKQIEVKLSDGTWSGFAGEPNWAHGEYRIAPPPEWLPLTSDDITAYTEFLSPKNQRHTWERINDDTILISGNWYSLTSLHSAGWKYRIPATSWHPCCKLATPSNNEPVTEEQK